MQNSGQETPYQIALREHPPLPNGSWVRYKSRIPGNTGEIIGHGAAWEDRVFQHWVYTIVPYGLRWNGFIMHTIERPGTEVTPL